MTFLIFDTDVTEKETYGQDINRSIHNWTVMAGQSLIFSLNQMWQARFKKNTDMDKNATFRELTIDLLKRYYLLHQKLFEDFSHNVWGEAA